MSAIFISYTGRDPEGDAWADRLEQWFKEWDYGFFRDKNHRDGVKAGDDWRATLYAELDDATAMVCLCSQQYDSSPWCVGEVAIAVEKGKTVIPIQLVTTADELKKEPLPLLLQTRQAIKVAGAKEPSPEQLAEVKQRLQATLREKLNWRDLQHWDRSLAPYPGLPAFEEQQAPVFFGRDKAIEAVVERLEALALRPGAFLLLLGASGYGKSSLVRAGVAPRLKGTGAEGMTVVPPFTPGDEPFQELEEAVAAADGVFDPADPLGSLRALQRRNKKPVLLVIDQFEELLSAGPKEEGTADQGELFQGFLLQLLRSRKPGLMVLATMRTDFLAPLQSRWPALTAMASTITLEPIQPEDFGVLITGPAKRASLTLEAGLETRLVKESGGRDALPLLAFTLEKLWKARTGQCLTLKAYDDLEGVEGSVGKRAKECWDPQTSSEAVRQALREAFLDHLVSVGGDGREAKRPAPMDSLPLASREIVQKMVDDRLLVLNNGIVEIAHEALLRTWDPLVQWLEESQEERLQGLRVKRLTPDLAVEAPQRQRRQALEQLAALAAAGGIEQKAVAKEGLEPLAQLLAPRKTKDEDPPTAPEADRADAALILALIGAEKPLSACLEDGAAPVELRRRAAESLGLLAKRSGDPAQRERIEEQLEAVLRGEPLDVRVVDAAGWKQHDEHLPLLQGAAQGLQLAASAGLPLLSSGLGRVVPMLTLTALEEAGELQITTDVVEVEVWSLPLPGGEQLELVMVPGGEYLIGSPADERDKNAVLDWFAANCDGCRDLQTRKPVDVEAERRVELAPFWLVRHPISQGQWKAVVEGVEAVHQELEASPGKANPDNVWDRHGQPGDLAVDSVNWHSCQEWLRRLNRWLGAQWVELGGAGEPLQLALPGGGQWEAACRAGTATPFHFGDTLDARWARYEASYVFGLGRKGAKAKQPGVNGGCGLVNRYGLAEMHGQLSEWCADSWHPNPVGEGWRADGLPWKGEDGDLAQRESGQRGWMLLRGGSWRGLPHICRAAARSSYAPDSDDAGVGLRPCCCPSPPGSLLGS
jgi:formylglycine-generating enzyme required for sulfatase activity